MVRWSARGTGTGPSIDGDPMPDTSTPLAGHRILLVEDEMLVSMLIEDVVKELGCEVVGPAADRDVALSLAETEDVDVALLDVNLGGEPVFPVADVLRTRGVPFAFISGYGQNGVADRYADVPTLAKPFRLASVEDTIADLIRTRQP